MILVQTCCTIQVVITALAGMYLREENLRSTHLYVQIHAHVQQRPLMQCIKLKLWERNNPRKYKLFTGRSSCTALVTRT